MCEFVNFWYCPRLRAGLPKRKRPEGPKIEKTKGTQETKGTKGTEARSRTMTLYAVILSVTKDLLAGYTLSTLSLVGFEEILRYTQNDIHNIIANF